MEQTDPVGLEVSFVMPCLNEAATLAACIRGAQGVIAEHHLAAELVIADNGSTDGSQEIARSLGARVLEVPERGYGNALRAGIAAAEGEFIVMADADDSYHFNDAVGIIAELRKGSELVMGNRLSGGILPGAMPPLNRLLGNPVLSRLGRIFFAAPVRDFHCGMRGFSKAAYVSWNLHTTGMEFASEMVIKASFARARISEVPVTLHPDGRSRPPHLRPWRDGWRHLRFMLLLAPRWLFLAPGLLLLAVGGVGMAWLEGGPRSVGTVILDIHTLLICGLACLLGAQLIAFTSFAETFAARERLAPRSSLMAWFGRRLSLETGALAGALLCLAGILAIAAVAFHWLGRGFGPENPQVTMRQVIPAAILAAIGAQVFFSSFFLGIMALGTRPPD